MVNNKVYGFIIIFLLGVGFLPVVLGLGVTPAKSQNLYAEKSSIRGSFKVVGFENDTVYSLSTAGQLKDYITLHKNMITPSLGDDTVSYTLNFPPAGDVSPGENIGKIYVTKVAEGREGISGQVNVHHVVSAWVPYPGYYLIPELSIRLEEGYYNFITQVRNLGSNNIKTAWVEVNVYDDEKLASLTMKRLNTHDTAAVESYSTLVSGSDVRKLALPTIETSIASGQTKDMVVSIRGDNLGLLPGNYGAESVVHYDGQKVTDEARFDVGVHMVYILNASTSFIENEVNRLYVTMYNDWNSVAADAYLKISFIDKSGNAVDSVASFNFNLEPRANKEVMIYFNANRIKAGEYIARITVYYNGLQSTKDFNVLVVSKEEAAKAVPSGEVKGKAAEEERGQFTMTFGQFDTVSVVLVILILLLALAIVGELFFFLHKSKKEQKREQK